MSTTEPTDGIRTDGISPKLILAFLFPFIASLAVTVTSWIATGDFNDAELRTALGGLVTSAVAALGAYVGHPGDVVDNRLPTYFEGIEVGPIPVKDEGDGGQSPVATLPAHVDTPKDAV